LKLSRGRQPGAREDRALLPRPPGDRLRSCPPTSAWRLPSPPLLHYAGHPTPSTATPIAACEGIEDPNDAVLAGALWRVAVWSEVKGEERAKPGPEDMNATQWPGAVLSHRPLTGSSVVDIRTAASRRIPMVVSFRTNSIAYQSISNRHPSPSRCVWAAPNRLRASAAGCPYRRAGSGCFPSVSAPIPPAAGTGG
jgi:hypothetical protein